MLAGSVKVNRTEEDKSSVESSGSGQHILSNSNESHSRSRKDYIIAIENSAPQNRRHDPVFRMLKGLARRSHGQLAVMDYSNRFPRFGSDSGYRGFHEPVNVQTLLANLRMANEPEDSESQDGESRDGESRDGESRDGEYQDGESQASEYQDGESRNEESQDGESRDRESQDGESQNEEAQNEESQNEESQNGEEDSPEEEDVHDEDTSPFQGKSSLIGANILSNFLNPRKFGLQEKRPRERDEIKPVESIDSRPIENNDDIDDNDDKYAPPVVYEMDDGEQNEAAPFFRNVGKREPIFMGNDEEKKKK